MMLDIPQGKSIIVFTSYRTGSTALCEYLSNAYNLENFDEVFHEFIPDRTERFLNHKGNFVIKIMPDQITDQWRELIDQLVAKSFVIKLTRKDVIKQITSFCICCETLKWHHTPDDSNDSYSIIIKENMEDFPIKYICDNNKQLEELNYRCDLHLVYEDLNLDNIKYKIYNKPLNYTELLNIIKQKVLK